MEKVIKVTGDNIQISDGYHTFDELYAHRCQLFIALCRYYEEYKAFATPPDVEKPEVWRSRLHSDDTSLTGWFILGIGKLSGTQITYHLPISLWQDTHFAEILDRAPEFDGHTSADVLERLKQL